MPTPTQTPQPHEMVSVEPQNYEQIEIESEDAVLEAVLSEYQIMLGGYKSTMSRTTIVQQTKNFSGVAGPIYSSQHETSVSLKSSPTPAAAAPTATIEPGPTITPSVVTPNMGSY